MAGSVWWGRGMKTAVAGTVLAMLLTLAAYPFMPDVVIKHGDLSGPDDWTTKGTWLLFQLLFLPGIAAFVMLLVSGTTAAGPGALNLNDPDRLAYWSAPDHWPTARRLLVDATGTFVAGFVVCLAVMLTVGAAAASWRIPYWLTWSGPLVLVGLLLWWYVRAMNRGFRIPAEGRRG